jgi:hypothetical protein
MACDMVREHIHAASLCRGRGAHFAQRGLGGARVIEANMGLLREEGGGG